MKYYQVTQDITNLAAFLEYYDNELDEARKECKINGNLEQNLQRLPGIVEYRFSQLQEIEAVLEYLNIEYKKIKQSYYKKYLEGYSKVLSSRDAEKYAESEDEVIEFALLVNETALIRNRYLSIMKGIEAKGYSLNNITKLKSVGLDDVSL